MSDTDTEFSGTSAFVLRLPKALADASLARAKALGISRNTLIQRLLEADTTRSITAGTTAPASSTIGVSFVVPQPAPVVPVAVLPAVSPIAFCAALVRVGLASVTGDGTYDEALAEAVRLAGDNAEACDVLQVAMREADARLRTRARAAAPPEAPAVTEPTVKAPTRAKGAKQATSEPLGTTSQNALRKRYGALLKRRDGGSSRASEALKGLSPSSAKSLQRWQRGQRDLSAEATVRMVAFLAAEGIE